MTQKHLVAFAAGAAVGWITAGFGQKGQDLRLADVFLLGPWLIALSSRTTPLTDAQRLLLAFTAGATITHNGRNWLVQRNAETRA